MGGGLGFGGLRSLDGSGFNNIARSGLAYTARLGFGLAPRLILMWDVEGAVVDNGPSFISQTAHLAALQLFLTNRLFVKGGFGLARVDYGDVAFTEWGGAAMGGVGYELVQGYNWSFDIEATATGARFGSTNNSGQTATSWSLVNFAINFF
jgi:hypothetical protein